MSKLTVNRDLALNLAWDWVKFSLIIFRERVISYLILGILFLLLSMLPLIGSFLAIFVLARIYIYTRGVVVNQSLSIRLNLIELIKQKNLLIYALFSLGFDLIAMGITQELLIKLGLVGESSSNLVINPAALKILVIYSLVRLIFFGVSLPIIVFNPQVRLLESLILSWKFIVRHLILIILSLFFLMAFFIIPAYVVFLLISLITNSVFIYLGVVLLVLIILIAILVTTIFAYKLYQDGIKIV